MHILIAPDKFKGSLDAREAALAISRGFQKFFPGATYKMLPLADGGEGMLDAFRQAAAGDPRHATVFDALGRNVQAVWLMLEDGTAVIESSQANGLWRIAENERDVSRSSTYGVGQLMRQAADVGARRMIVGIGGSATNDAGIGLAAALGCRFLDANGAEIEPVPSCMPRIAAIDSTGMSGMPPLRVACDVSNPLLGPRGASRTYGPQKGLRPEDVDLAEAAHARFAAVCAAHFGEDFKDMPGAGAAGGIGYALMTFCNAILESGFDCVAGALEVESHIASADMVITGEGSIDSQTLEGKTPYGVARLAAKHGIPVYALAGRLADEDLLREHFDGIAPIVNAPMSLDEALRRAPELLELAAARLAHMLVPISR